MRPQRAEVDEVDPDERDEDQVGSSSPGDRDSEPEHADEQGRPEAVPQPDDERDRRDVVVLEAQPAAPREALHVARVAEGAGEMGDEERARRTEGDEGQPKPDREAAGLPIPRDRQRDEEEHARVLETGRDARDEAAELQLSADEQGERHRDAEHQRDVGDRHPGIGDGRRLDGDGPGHHYELPLGKRGGHAKVLLDEQEGHPLPLEVLTRFHQLLDDRGRKPLRRLVHDQ